VTDANKEVQSRKQVFRLNTQLQLLCHCCSSAHNPFRPHPQLKTSDPISNRNLTVVRDKNQTQGIKETSI